LRGGGVGRASSSVKQTIGMWNDNPVPYS
jgi:hypothetical protein